jgi:transcriptional regulator with XRE-family HTH domain
LVYENVLSLCRKEGISISALENKCGLGNATIRGWEKGSPRLDRVKPVADYFGVTVDWLMEDHTEQLPEG